MNGVNGYHGDNNGWMTNGNGFDHTIHNGSMSNGSSIISEEDVLDEINEEEEEESFNALYRLVQEESPPPPPRMPKKSMIQSTSADSRSANSLNEVFVFFNFLFLPCAVALIRAF